MKGDRAKQAGEQRIVEEVRQLVRNGLVAREHVIVHEIAERLFELFQERGPSAGAAAGMGDGWERIESLSRLRGVVGGRFQNLKERWVKAGFPLREHRGDRSGRSALNTEGWLELAAWIGKHGFECRLADAEADWLFELRKIA